MGLSSFNQGYSIGTKSRFLCGGGDGIITITTPLGLGNWILYVVHCRGYAYINVSANTFSAGVSTVYGNVSFTAVYTKHAATAEKPAYAELVITPSIGFAKLTLFACFPDVANGDNCILGITNKSIL